MSSDYEEKLAASVQRELDALGELAAPPALAHRIMRKVGQHYAGVWYRRSWPTWPRSIQCVSFMALLAVFGGICFAAASLAQVSTASNAAQHTSLWLSSLALGWRTLGVLSDAAVTAIQHMGMKAWLGCLLILFVTYTAGVGLGTACFRLAVPQR